MWTGLLEAWRNHVQMLEDPPVMMMTSEFLTEVRKVNPLVSSDHCKQLMQQLEVKNQLLKILFFFYLFKIIN